MKHLLPFLTAGIVFAGLPLSVLAGSGDWPQWRGPNRDGRSTETGLLQDWPEGGPPLVWKATGVGIGYATVSVVGERLFTMGDKDDANYVMALNRADGKPLWTAKVGKAGAPGWGGFAGPRCTPTVDGDRVYAVGQYGEAVCLDATIGEEVWRKDYAQDFGSELPEWGYAGMPLVDGDRVILVPGGKRGNLVALNKQTGEVIWQSKEFTDGIHYSSPIVVEIGGVRQYLQLTDASVAGIAAADGRMLWRARAEGIDRRDSHSDLSRPPRVRHLGVRRGLQSVQVTAANGEFSAEQVYANKIMVNHHGGVLLLGKHVYGHSDGKGWTCQDLLTGEATWQEKGKLGKGSLTYADGRFYCRAEDGKGTVALLEATPEGYRERGRFDPPDRSKKNSWAHPVVAGGRLYLRDQDVLLCYDVRAK